LIAEIKNASPSKGIIAEDFDAARQAQLYRDGGADCLSVLTEPDFFQGDLSHLSEARTISGVPCLRKDFIIDQWQIAQARLHGADCILIIVAILKDWEIRAFKAAAHRYGMDALVEVHNEEEARRAVANGCQFVGINNRDLKTFEVDLATTERLRPLLPAAATVVAESGVFTAEDAKRLRDAGADALLVGESLMKSGDVATAIRALQTA
jgi:indole-3-glycerol phosphate synthase